MSDVQIDVNGPVMQIAMNRPEKRNALTVAMYAAMVDALAKAEADDAIRAVIIAGHESGFCGGNDVNDFLANPPQDESAPVIRFLRTISTARKPLVAAVQGTATGIGTTMLLHCDVVVLSDDAQLITPFVDLGLVAELASTLTMPLLMGHARAARHLLLGERMTADEAFDLGIATNVVPHSLVMQQAQGYAERLAAKPPVALQETKRLMRLPFAKLTQDQITEEVRVFSERLGSSEAREAFTAFLEKRAVRS